MLKKLCAERPTDWDKYIEAVLFAYREVPQESLGFAPFELLYGRTVHVPMSILRELWTKEIVEIEYVCILFKWCEMTVNGACVVVTSDVTKARSRLMNCTLDTVKKHLKSLLFAPSG